ncbi:MAG: hypothetical protein ACLQPH_05400, partial [Acidimicrobiales bacterium]
HPLDRNLYQAVKGLAAAERVVGDGGVIVLAAACVDGVPAGGAFARVLAEGHTPAALAGARGPTGLDTWQAQVLGRVLARVEVWVHTSGVPDDVLSAAGMVPVDDLEAAVAGALGRRPDPRLCVLPQGPLTVATVVHRA